MHHRKRSRRRRALLRHPRCCRREEPSTRHHTCIAQRCASIAKGGGQEQQQSLQIMRASTCNTESIRTTSTGQPLVRRPARRTPTTQLPPQSTERPPTAVSQPGGYSCTAEHQAGQCRHPDGDPAAEVRLRAVPPTPLGQPPPHRHILSTAAQRPFLVYRKAYLQLRSIMVPTFPRKIVAKLIIN